MVFTDEVSDNELSENNKKHSINPQHLEILADLLTNEGGHLKKRHMHHTKVVEDDNPRRHKNKNIKIGGDGDIIELMNMDSIKSLKRHHKDHNIVDKTKVKSFEQWFEDSETRRVIRSADFTESKSHKRRSIYDNELPYDKLHLKDSKPLTTTTQEVTTETSLDEDDDKNLIPYPPGMRRKRKKKSRRGKKRNQRSKTTKLPDEWHQVREII